jgi:hypothetical protein
MEALHMPYRDVLKRYTKSEMAIMAWRSQEQSASLKKPKTQVPLVNRPELKVQQTYGADPDVTALEERLGPVANRLGEDLDLRKLTGQEAIRFLGAQGMRIPFMGPRAKGK